MTEPNELAALKASLRGATGAGDALTALRDRFEALDAGADLRVEDLEELARIAAGHAIAAAALRGLVETLLARRGAVAEERREPA